MTYNPQPIQPDDINHARAWYEQHRLHVDRMLVEVEGPGYAPCGSDCIRPELWKAEHWKWLIRKWLLHDTRIVLTQFAIDRHWESERAGTTITDISATEFEQKLTSHVVIWRDGYAPFCKLLFVRNFTNACVGTMPITPENEWCLKSAYKSRNDEELPVLVRWFENLPEVPEAEYLCLVLYTRGQLVREGTCLRMAGEVDYGVVAILGQSHSEEEPMTPMTAMRNALGVKEGGSGVMLDRAAYMRSVEFWDANAAVKLQREKSR